MLEKSWDGTAVHTELGYNIGKPSYGYTARRVPHPVPAKRAKGAKKTYLDPDPCRPRWSAGSSAGGSPSGWATRASPTASTPTWPPTRHPPRLTPPARSAGGPPPTSARPASTRLPTGPTSRFGPGRLVVEATVSLRAS